MNFQITKLKQKRRAKEYRSIFEKHKVISNLDKINQKILEPDFWNNKSEAQKIFKKKKFLEELVNTHKKSITEVKDTTSEESALDTNSTVTPSRM